MNPGTLLFSAPAKINFVLQVLSQRSDGYHNLQTIFQSIGLCDEIKIRDKRGSIELKSSGIKVPAGLQNLAYKAAALLKERARLKEHGAVIHLLKRIPTGAGLGGGSSDAAAVLKGLNQIWGLRWSESRLKRIWAELGSDVPFFLDAGTALGTGRGEKLKPLPPFPKTWLVLVWPGFAVSTAWAYQKLKKHRAVHGLPSYKPHAKLFCLASQKKDVRSALKTLSNDLEEPVFREHPLLARIKQSFLNHGAQAALMSGSGSMVFGVAGDRNKAVLLAKKIKPLARKVWITHTC